MGVRSLGIRINAMRSGTLRQCPWRVRPRSVLVSTERFTATTCRGAKSEGWRKTGQMNGGDFPQCGQYRIPLKVPAERGQGGLARAKMLRRQPLQGGE